MSTPEVRYAPQLARLVRTPPDGDDWLHEIKFDGYRIGVRIHGRRARLVSRTGRDWTAAFPGIATAALDLPTGDALLDGEVAAVLPDGRTSFHALQQALSRRPGAAPIVYFVFDLLRLDGRTIEALPLEERKARLRSLCSAADSGCIRYTDHIVGNGPRVFDQVCRAGLEGVVSKRRDGPYRHGSRSGWVKAKCLQRGAFVICGFTDPEGTRAGIGALVLGCRDGARLMPAGKVGTGFTRREADTLRAELEALETRRGPFDAAPARLGRVHWVRPVLVCEVTFAEWTADGRLRHPSFLRLRPDVSPAAAAVGCRRREPEKLR